MSQKRRWLLFQAFSLLLAGVLLALLWRPGVRWPRQPILVPMWIALTPLMIRPWWLRQPLPPTREAERRAVGRGLIIGMAFAQAATLVPAAMQYVPWRAVMPVLLLCTAIQLTGVGMLLARRSDAARN